MAFETPSRGDGPLLVGAAVGTGLAARGAVRGGCDILLALNVAKLRSMGGTSMASLLPLRDSNELVMEFGTAELLPARGRVPVFFGACCFDPRLDLEALVERVADAGFQGIVNFPTTVSFAAPVCRHLEAAGVGFAREIELLRLAQSRGLHTLAYVGSLQEAHDMAEIAVDMINLNLGWHTRGLQNLRSSLDILEAADLARSVFREVRRTSPGTGCLVDGGPIVNPNDMYEICDASRADGYIGGSTVDSVPLESAVEEAVAAFKTVSALRHRQPVDRPVLRRHLDAGLVGLSKPMTAVRRAISRLSRTRDAVLITGPAGAGKELVARTLAAEAGGKSFICTPCDDWLEESLFGAAPGVSKRITSPRMGLLEEDARTTLFLEDLTQTSLETQGRLLAALETGVFLRLGDSYPRPVAARLVFAAREKASALASDPRVHRALALYLARREIRVPPLIERMEDLPVLTRHILASLASNGRPIKVGRSLYSTLMSHSWPGNVRELRTVLEQAVINAGGQPFEPEHLPPLRADDAFDDGHDERSWILDALHRHRFRRGETADFLGISRKTLYNKMKRLSIATETKGLK